MPSFLQPSLIPWLLPLVCVPILIHLINLLRHRRVQWAAMTFLMQSQKRNRNWVRFRQLLLLLLRMLAIAAIVFMLAGPLLMDQWSKLFGETKTHHVVLLDDSGSMSDRWDNTTAFVRAKEVVRRLAERASKGDSEHRFTVLPFSQAQSGKALNILHEQVTSDFTLKLDGKLTKLSPTHLSMTPLESLEAVERLVTTEEDETLVVYVVSDFRTPEWQDATALRQTLARLQEDNAQLQLVQCVDRQQANLAITSLRPTEGVRAAGIELKMEIEVTNFGTEMVRDVQVQIESRTLGDEDSAADVTNSLPAVIFDAIGPQQTVKKTFPALFPTAGNQEVVAQLPDDALAGDNRRFSIVEISPQEQVLILDGGGGIDDPFFLKLALAPPRARTGRKVVVQPPEFLRNNSLEPFRTVYLLNIDQLEASAVEAIEDYVRSGGGLVFFASDRTRSDFVNQQLYRDGEGVFPLPLVSPASLFVDEDEKTPDLRIDESHSIFRRIAADEASNNLFPLIQIERYYASRADWKDGTDSRPKDASDEPAESTEGENSKEKPDNETNVIARIRTGEPLIVEKRFGQGRSMAVLTTSAPIWNNWASNPTFIATMLDAQVYVSQAGLRDPARQVGAPLSVDLSVDDYSSDVQFTQPSLKGSRTYDRNAKIDKENTQRMAATLDETFQPGIYEIHLTRTEAAAETQRFAYNVPPREGELAIAAREDIQTLLEDISYDYFLATELMVAPVDQAGFKLGEYWLFFVVLVLLLIGEQLLAYSASYHRALAGGQR